jgi:hypothetical protein
VQQYESVNASVVFPRTVHDALLKNAAENDRSFSREVRRACVFYLKHVDQVQQLGTSAAAVAVATAPRP